MSLSITAEQIAAFPPVGMAHTAAHAFSPDGSKIACLWADDGSAQRALWLYDRAAKTFAVIVEARHGLQSDHEPSHDETMAREITRERWLGISRFSWSPDGKSILMLCANRLLRYELESKKLSTYTHGGYVAFAAFSADSSQIAFHAENELWVIGAGFNGPAHRLTASVNGLVLSGVADKVTREEMGNQRAFWWAKDGKSLFFARYDIEPVPIIMVGSGLQDDAETISYARPGETISTFSFHRVEIASGVETILREADAKWPYLVGCDFDGDGNPILNRVNREQTLIQFLKLTSISEQLVHVEHGTPWINVLGSPLMLADKESFLFLHERKGYGAIAHHKADGTSTDITNDDCGHVERTLGLSADKTAIYFIGTGNDPRSRHVFKAGLDGSNIKQLTTGNAIHSVTFAPNKLSWLHTIDQLSTPPRIVLENLEGVEEFAFPAFEHRLSAHIGKRTPELFITKAGDNKTGLHAALYRPTNPKPKAPLVVAVYGGPHVQVVRHSWAMNADLRTQRLLDAGFYVLKVDNRGSSGRGIAFEKPVYGHLGEYEVDDQAAAVAHVLQREKGIDAERVFVTGWSYGGYMTLMCLCRYPNVFSGGVSGAPVTTWAEYDAQYTERYMGTPQSNPEGYAKSAIMPYLRNMHAVPLLIHGMKDENVLFRHSGLLFEEAARINKLIYCLPLPRERHSASGKAARIYVEDQLFTYLCQQAGV